MSKYTEEVKSKLSIWQQGYAAELGSYNPRVHDMLMQLVSRLERCEQLAYSLDNTVRKYHAMFNADVELGRPKRVTQRGIDELIERSRIDILPFDTTRNLVIVKLPCGYSLLDFYNNEAEYDRCLARIKDKLWELESYRLFVKGSGYNDECYNSPPGGGTEATHDL